MATTSERVAIGAFVTVINETGRNLGIGKVVEISGHRATVAYFDVPGETQPFQIDAPVTAVRVVALAEQTRVFRCDEDTGRWQVGRIIDGEGPACLVAFPNRVTANLPRAALQVRWRRPIRNPTEFLIRQVTETPLFAEARSKFMQALTAQRAGCRGMGALLSSSVQLEAYQFNVVRRVLQDPIQRYLLADEVGLGKTVEAGLLIRQYTLDGAVRGGAQQSVALLLVECVPRVESQQSVARGRAMSRGQSYVSRPRRCRHRATIDVYDFYEQYTSCARTS